MARWAQEATARSPLRPPGTPTPQQLWPLCSLNKWEELTPDTKVIYRRYASLFFITSITPGDNELITLEIIHRYVEVLDRYFGNVSDRRRRAQRCHRQPLVVMGRWRAPRCHPASAGQISPALRRS